MSIARWNQKEVGGARSDKQIPDIRHLHEDEFAQQNKARNYPKHAGVNPVIYEMIVIVLN